jgi:energy-coupling factor transporter transmembrane protein EcfT
MHSIIRLACFLLLIAGLATTRHLLFIIVVPVFLGLFKYHCTFREVLPLLRRLRWLFLSLLILNLWFSSPELQLVPSLQGIITALERITALIILVLAAHLLLRTTPTTEIISALTWWFAPLRYIGVRTEIIALRLSLVLDTVREVQALSLQLPPRESEQNRIQYISASVSQLFITVSQQAENTALRCLEIPKLEPIPWQQWTYPLLLIFLMLA